MNTANLPKRLNYGDAAFANFERAAMPMNVGSAGIYAGAIDFPSFVAHVERRIGLVPRYRQRLVPIPFDLAFPAWVDDPRFDIRRHVALVHLPPPGTREQLADLAGEFFSVPLERDKPLWEVRLVDGLDDGGTAHLAKVHHCMVDGVAGVGLLAAVLDGEPSVAEERHEEPPPPGRTPDALELAIDAVFDGLIDQLRLNERTLLALADPARTWRTARSIVRAFAAAGGYFAVPAPRTLWSMRLTRPRKLAWQAVPFSDARDVAKALRGTINEVVLTVLGGALGRYLEARGDSTEDVVLRAATPVNVRGTGDDGALGNRVSFMLIGMPVGEHDPIERFRAIHRESRTLKEIGQARGVDALLQLIGASPSAVHSLIGGTLSFPNTLSNLVCTNVRGPLTPLYLMGHRMVEHYPWVPLGWRMGMSVAVMSYDRGLYFSFSGDERAPDDIHRVAPLLVDAFRELRVAALGPNRGESAAAGG